MTCCMLMTLGRLNRFTADFTLGLGFFGRVSLCRWQGNRRCIGQIVQIYQNKPFGVSCNGYSLRSFLDHMPCFSTSMTAWKARSCVLEIRNGAPPGTISTFSSKLGSGTTSACSLFKVPRLPKRKVTLQGHLDSYFRMFGCK